MITEGHWEIRRNRSGAHLIISLIPSLTLQNTGNKLKIANEYFSKEVFYLIRNKMTGCKIRVRSGVACSRLGKRNDKIRLSQSKCGFPAAIGQNVGEKTPKRFLLKSAAFY